MILRQLATMTVIFCAVQTTGGVENTKHQLTLEQYNQMIKDQ